MNEMDEFYFVNFTKLAHDNLTESEQNNFNEVNIIELLNNFVVSIS